MCIKLLATLLFTVSLVSVLPIAAQLPTHQIIDRHALVSRHNVVLEAADPLAPLSVGNGDFAFTADVTGMQSLEHYYYENGIPLETMCNWAWHAFPNVHGYTLQDASKASNFHGRQISYPSEEKSPAGQYFRLNPHPIPLGQISLVKKNGEVLDLKEITGIHQQLDLWTGVITSHYEIDGQPVTVETVCHPDKSVIAFTIKSPLLRSGALRPAFRFPYAYDFSSQKNKPSFDWSHPDLHTTTVIHQSANGAILQRRIDTSGYVVDIQWTGKGQWGMKAPHEFYLDASGSDSLCLVCTFTPDRQPSAAISFQNTKHASAQYWKGFWTKGGAVDMSGCTDPRAKELERKTVLSQYLMRVNYAGSFPPQETGLAHLSWYGKHNAEVYWIHAAQFYEWNHTELLEKGLQWYRKILPKAQEDARSKGFAGARWPKMSGYDGEPTPGGINPFIIWNQPNPIYLSELVYRAHPDKATLTKYRDIVLESGKFLASYAFYDSATHRYILGPPIKSVNERGEENETKNPSFELAQWYYGLHVAQQWRIRLGLKPDAHWEDILQKLSRLTIADGKYVEIETEPDMYQGKGGYSSAMLMALGYLPQTPMVDKQIMENTFRAIVQRNGIRSFVSWSQGKGALTAARLGDTQTAIDIVCNEAPNAHFNKSGYIPRPKEGLGCPAYLPTNSALLAAIGLMAGGWDHAPAGIAPGFPKDGKWDVKVEGMLPLP